MRQHLVDMLLGDAGPQGQYYSYTACLCRSLWGLHLIYVLFESLLTTDPIRLQKDIRNTAKKTGSHQVIQKPWKSRRFKHAKGPYSLCLNVVLALLSLVVPSTTWSKPRVWISLTSRRPSMTVKLPANSIHSVHWKCLSISAAKHIDEVIVTDYQT